MIPYRAPETPVEVALMIATLSVEDAGRIEFAYRFAAAAHDGQTRDEGTPFIEHPVRVARILWENFGSRDVDAIIAALNHDVLEDCDWLDTEILRGALGEASTELIEHVTKEQVSDDKTAARDRAYLDRLWEMPSEARLLKLADRLDNLRSVVNAGDPAKAQRYLTVSREEFISLALATDPVAARLIGDACDEIERYLEGEDRL